MLNKVILIGHSSRKPSLKESSSGTKYANFSIATNTGYGEKKTTDWHEITAFGKLAEICSQYIDKGTMVYIEGRIQYSVYEKDGQKHKSVSIIANEVTLLSSKQVEQLVDSQRQSENQNHQQDATNDFDFSGNDTILDEIPF